MSISLKEAFKTLMTEYNNIYTELYNKNDFKHPFGGFIRKTIPEAIVNTGVLNNSMYSIKASCGFGRWTIVPWIAVFDNRITKGASEGVYIVYLLNKDTQELFLTFNQATFQKKSQQLITHRDEVRNRLNYKSLESSIITGSKEYDTACIYSKKYTLHSLPSEQELLNDLKLFLKIYKEYYNTFIKDAIIDFIPTNDEYNPGFTKEEWLRILNDSSIIGPVWGNALAMFYTEKDGATCSQLGKKFNRNATSISGNCTQLAKRIHAETNCPLYENQDGKLMYWPILFVGRHANTNDEGSFVWKLRDELYEALTEFDILRYLEEGGEKTVTVKDTVNHISDYIASKGFTYPDGMIENFYLSLKSKPFVILAGTSGTGKTRLVKLFSEAIGATTANGRYQLVSVRPDWSDSSDLFGHVDLNGKFVPGAIIDLVKRAELDKQNPYFLCLDEMNLARVEYYLSDILSIIETRDFKDGEIVSDPLIDSKYFGKDSSAAGKYGTLRLPENLYIIGTVNMDETTFPFSRKVLDRANTIEFSYVDLVPDYENTPVSVSPLALKNDFLKTNYLLLSDCDDDSVNTVCVELKKINDILEKASAHIGYRVRDEVAFYMINNNLTGLLDNDEAFDNEIMQKILPRIQGSSASVKNMLCELFKVCAADYEGYQTSDNVSDKMLAVLMKETCKYRKSAEKIAFMVRRYEEDGFTSYWL